MTSPYIQNDALVTKPLKTSPATGAALATMGFTGAIPLIHGSQGCSAFSKVFLISHFREPFPIQNSAIDQVAAVMGTDENLTEALKNICQRQNPQVLTVLTSGLVEMQGCDIWRVIKDFKHQNPEFESVQIVPVSTPDFKGTMETGFAKTIDVIVKQCCDPSPQVTHPSQVNVLCSASTTTADIELIERYLTAFDLTPIFIPNIARSLDGHLEEGDYHSTSTGGTSIEQIKKTSSSGFTLLLGDSLKGTAQWLEKRFAIPWRSISMGMQGTDDLVDYLTQYTLKPVPNWIERARSRLQDAMLDTHFVLTHSEVALAVEPDLAFGLVNIFDEVGMRIKKIVTTHAQHDGLKKLSHPLAVGDMSLLDDSALSVDLLFGNSHLNKLNRSSAAFIKVGFPCNDVYGNSEQCFVGYEGMRSQLFRMANALMERDEAQVTPHVSIYSFTSEEVVNDCA
ncbi:nitrogenase iron-molybdenum cofactor biosynthesis protein NifN [Vibrio astriarenae]